METKKTYVIYKIDDDKKFEITTYENLKDASDFLHNLLISLIKSGYTVAKSGIDNYRYNAIKNLEITNYQIFERITYDKSINH